MSHTFSYLSMGTTWKITIWDKISAEQEASLEKEIVRMSNEFDHTYSRFIKTSLVSKLSNETGIFEVSKDFTDMLSLYKELYIPSGRKLNPLIGFTISDLGYDAEYSLTPKESIRKTPDFNETLRITDETHIELRSPVLIDVGALGKGFFVDKIVAFLSTQNLTHFLVDGSGDIFYKGPDIIRAGLEDPDNPHLAIGVLPMGEGAFCGSGTNRRRWREYHHVIDPLSGKSTEGIAATWVMAKSCALADALASCLFFATPEEFSNYDFEYLIMKEDRTIVRSSGFTAELFNA